MIRSVVNLMGMNALELGLGVLQGDSFAPGLYHFSHDTYDCSQKDPLRRYPPMITETACPLSISPLPSKFHGFTFVIFDSRFPLRSFRLSVRILLLLSVVF